MNCSRAVSVLLPPLCTSSVRFFARFPTVSAQFFAEAKFYRVDELACILKARNEVVMNTNRVRKKSKLYLGTIDAVLAMRRDSLTVALNEHNKSFSTQFPLFFFPP